MSKKLSLLSTALLLATAILAQQDTIKSTPLDEVVVTANKVAQKQSTTGKVVTVITKDEIEKSNGKTVSQLLNEQVGIVINGALNNVGTVQNLNMRGASSGRTLILLDGIPIHDPSDINNNFDLNLISLAQIEKIEICKGAQSTLYGSDAVAGVINIISNKGTNDKPFNGNATATYGTFNSFNANVRLYGGIDKFKYNIGYSKASTDGFSAANDSSGKGNFDKDGNNSDVVTASVQYQATKQLLFKGSTMQSQYSFDADASQFTDKKNYSIKNSNSIQVLGFNYKKEGFILTGNYQYNRVVRTFDDNYSIGHPIFSYFKYNGITQLGELYSNVNLGSGFSLLGGVEYRYGSMNNYTNLVSGFGPYTNTFNDTSVNQKSIYASINYIDNSKKFTAEFGGRYNNHSRYGTSYTYTFNPSYAIADNFRLFGSIATAFKIPSLYQLFSNDGGGNVNLQPEKSVNFEIGYQANLKGFNDRLVFFYRDISSGIDYDNNNWQYFNYSGQRVRGIEYEFTVKPMKQITVKGNYTFISTNQSTESRITNKDTTYSYTLHVPKHAVNITVGYQIVPSFYVSLSGKYVSKRFDGIYQMPDATLDSYFLLGANAQYLVNKNIKLFADAKNITNKKFFDIYGYNSIPAMFNFGISANW